MELMEAIRARKSYRNQFEDTPVPRNDLREILEAGVAAPSGCNMQTTQLSSGLRKSTEKNGP